MYIVHKGLEGSPPSKLKCGADETVKETGILNFRI